MKQELIFSKFTKVTSNHKGGRIAVNDQFLNDFVGCDVLIEVYKIDKNLPKTRKQTRKR